MGNCFLFTCVIALTFTVGSCYESRLLNLRFLNYSYHTGRDNDKCCANDASTDLGMTSEAGNDCSDSCNTFFNVSLEIPKCSDSASVGPCLKMVRNTGVITDPVSKTSYTFHYFTDSSTEGEWMIVQMYGSDNPNQEMEFIDQFETSVDMESEPQLKNFTGPNNETTLTLIYTFSRNECSDSTPSSFMQATAQGGLVSETPPFESCDQSGTSFTGWMITAFVLMLTTALTSTSCVALCCVVLHNRMTLKKKLSEHSDDQQGSGLGQMDNPVYDAVAIKKSTKAPPSVLDLQNMHQVYRQVFNDLYSPVNKPTDQHYYKSGPIKNEESLYDLATECLDDPDRSNIYDSPPDALCESDEYEYATVRFEK